jgi:hypothetical protein
MNSETQKKNQRAWPVRWMGEETGRWGEVVEKAEKTKHSDEEKRPSNK